LVEQNLWKEGDPGILLIVHLVRRETLWLGSATQFDRSVFFRDSHTKTSFYSINATEIFVVIVLTPDFFFVKQLLLDFFLKTKCSLNFIFIFDVVFVISIAIFITKVFGFLVVYI
jgi:hypothetical protein